jgi:hypothetical protein
LSKEISLSKGKDFFLYFIQQLLRMLSSCPEDALKSLFHLDIVELSAGQSLLVSSIVASMTSDE